MKTSLAVFILFLFALPPKRVEVQQFPILDNFDLIDVEGQRLYFNPQHVNNLRIIVCGEHFPKSSQAFRNIRKVVRLYNNTPYIKVKFRPYIKRTLSHINEADLYECGTNRHQIFDNNDIYLFCRVRL